VARVLHCSDQEYHADPCATPSLSYSTAAELINVSPRSAYYYHPRLGGHRKKPTAPMKLGILADALLLGGTDRIREIPLPNWRTKTSQEERDAFLADGLIPALSHELQTATDLVSRILRVLHNDFGIHFTGTSQLALEWTEQSHEHGAVLCRGKLDHVVEVGGKLVIYDVKATADARPHKIQRRTVDMGYDIQAAAYMSAVEKWREDFAGRIDFIDLHCHIDGAVDVVPVQASGMLLDYGQMRWTRAIDTWAECHASNRWPGMATSIIPGEVPAYAMQREMEIQGL
jgi:hypothetical protein